MAAKYLALKTPLKVSNLAIHPGSVGLHPSKVRRLALLLVGLALVCTRQLRSQATTAPAETNPHAPSASQTPPPIVAGTVLPPPKGFNPEKQNAAILSHLNAVVRLFHLATAPIQKVGEPSDMLYRDQALAQTTQIADFAFESSRAEATLLAAFAKQAGTEPVTPAAGEAQKLQPNRASIIERLTDLKAQLDTINQRLATARPRQRAALQQQQEETQDGIQLYQQMSDAITKISAASDADTTGGLTGDIDRLQRSVPGLGAGKASAIVPSPIQNLSIARDSGVSTQAILLFQLLATRHAIENWVTDSNTLQAQAQALRTPLQTLVRSVIASGDALTQQIEDQNGLAVSSSGGPKSTTLAPLTPGSDLQATRLRYKGVTSTFNAVSSAIVPLTQEIIAIEQSHTNLLAWRAVVDSEYREVLRHLLVKILTIAFALGILFVLSSLWQRATTRYVRDIRRRRQLMVTRRVVIGFLSGLILIFGFVTQFNSLATFAGFITAGIAVGLQTILLSVAAYFFIVGRFGVRVGDRITVAGVTGDVIDVGLVRFYMMELAGSGTDLQPTGRVAVFANSVLFQSGTPLYRQMPGAEYGWHELSVKLALTPNYNQASDRLTHLVETVYETYKARIEGQHRQVETWMDSAIPAPTIESRLQLVEGGLELYVRYPVELRQGSQVDQQITQSVVKLMEEDAEVKAAVSAPPTIRAVVKG